MDEGGRQPGDGIVQLLGVGRLGRRLAGDGEGGEQVLEVAGEGGEVGEIVVDTDESQQLPLLLDEVGGGDELLAVPGPALVVGDEVPLPVDLLPHQAPGQFGHGVAHLPAAEVAVEDGHHRRLRLRDVVEDDLEVVPAYGAEEGRQGEVGGQLALVAHGWLVLSGENAPN